MKNDYVVIMNEMINEFNTLKALKEENEERWIKWGDMYDHTNDSGLERICSDAMCTCGTLDRRYTDRLEAINNAIKAIGNLIDLYE